MNIKRRSLLLAALAMLPLTGALAQADFPSRPIRLVISFPPGSTSDLLARHLGEHVSKTLGQPVVVESKPGAQGVIAARAVVNSPKDGYTLFLGTNSSHAAYVHLIKQPKYDPIKDFTPISQFTVNPLLLVVNAQLPVHSAQEFVKYAKERPGKLSFGTGNTGGLVAAQLLKAQAGIDAVGVSYPGTAQATTDLVAGRLDFMMIDPLVIRSFVEVGKVRVLGLTSTQRLPSMPEVTPLAEAGLPGYSYASWSGLFGPAGMPPEVTRRLSQAFTKAVTDPATEKYFADLGFIATSSKPEAFHAFVQDQITVWGRLTKEAGLVAQ
ncbi:Bug family tripartite tricarboxylate transporter substrate binding protein [Noviherbaspirillum sedimenti]|uniref:Tripartite tricarboxylate transporter substrate binding protein n=1 Tax=Noviherbaspirillum sedimenti TaxID=2320865 RepID=A0A3A3GQQ5_9BURK|nr:tripartite tricarboxylate transporter substrate binding protein [Noviherbaspirillum sedimenti]RJG03310.1 tripartite tricarboxylate transporter substrate binding protein [Noviherbaspirillum sedimenti]